MHNGGIIERMRVVDRVLWVQGYPDTEHVLAGTQHDTTDLVDNV